MSTSLSSARRVRLDCVVRIASFIASIASGAVPNKSSAGRTSPSNTSGLRARNRSRAISRSSTAWAFGNRFAGSDARQRSTISARC